MNKDTTKLTIQQKSLINNNTICKLYPIKNSKTSQTILSLFNIIDKYELINSKYLTKWYKCNI